MIKVLVRLALAAALFLAVSAAQSAQTEVEENGETFPLRGSDTSSPRATLQSFLDDSEYAIRAWRDGDRLSSRTFYAFLRAAETLDFTDTPEGDSWSVKTTRLLLLREILGRIELPPLSDVPGIDEVSGSDLNRWTIPNTRISIARQDKGPHADAFLFSSGSVERLERIFRRAESLPYKPGAMSGAYDAYMSSTTTVSAETARVRNRLKPVDTASPRSAVEGFLNSMNAAYGIVMAAHAALHSVPPAMTPEEAQDAELRAANYLNRAVKSLDLGGIPAALRKDIGVEAALQIKEVIDRIPLPPVETVPNVRDVAALREAGRQTRWRLPNSEIEIVEVSEGERTGEFLFSARTVRGAKGFYAEIADLPYRFENRTVPTDWRSLNVTDGFFDYYATTPGYLIPGTNRLSAIVEGLPRQMKMSWFGQTIWQWGGLVVVAVLIGLAAWLVFILMNLIARSLPGSVGPWLRVLSPVAVAALVKVAFDFIDDDLNVTGNILAVVIGITEAVVLVSLAYAIYLIFKALAETAVVWSDLHNEALNANLIRVLARVVGFFAAAYFVVAGARRIGADIIPLLAGLGVGGLAVALAAQKTLANFIGSLILLANKPVEEGDFCRYGDNQIGTVEKIGLHSTRIRTLERTVVTIPNADFSKMPLDNFSKRDERLFRTKLQLRYETTPDQMRYLLVRIRELLLGHPMVTPSPARARFVAFGDYSKDLEIYAYMRCREQGDFLAIQEDLLLWIEDAVADAGTGFAFPSQTAYLSRDGGLDAERGQRAAEQTQGWRATNKLPFPDFEEEDADNLEDTMDYPPKGSPGARG